MFQSLYNWLPSLSKALTEGDYIEYFEAYFVHTDVLTQVFLCALGISVGVAAIFYFVCCNLSIKFANWWSWLLFLVVSVAFTFFVTPTMVLGTDSGSEADSSGFYKTVYAVNQVKLDDNPEEGELRNAVDAELVSLKDELKGNSDQGDESIQVIREVAAVNALYTLLFFLIVTALTKVRAINNLTIHGKNIPI